jgi:hypothetical protein
LLLLHQKVWIQISFVVLNDTCHYCIRIHLEKVTSRLLEEVRQGHPIGGAAGNLSRTCALVKGYEYQTLEHHPSLVEGKKLPFD